MTFPSSVADMTTEYRRETWSPLELPISYAHSVTKMFEKEKAMESHFRPITLKNIKPKIKLVKSIFQHQKIWNPS